jgi:hypothetical protein
MFSKIGAILSGKYKKIRGIDDKLGLVEFKIEDVNLSKISEVKLPKEYENWHPGQQEERPDVVDISIDNGGKVAKYNSNRGKQ